MTHHLFRPSSLRRGRGVAALLLAALAWVPPTAGQTPPAAPPMPTPAPADTGGPAAPAGASAEDLRRFAEAARVAWRYVDQQYQPATGLINSVANYPYATMWDVASGLGALYSARELGLLPAAEYDRRMRRVLLTLQTMRLFDGIAFSKNYSTRSAEIAGRDSRVGPRERGTGYSALDLGRLLVWLKIIALKHPQYAEDIGIVVSRLDFSRIVESGYLWGMTVNRSGRTSRYVEGRIPYEQYAAHGYALWGHDPEKASRMAENSIPIVVLDEPLVADRRGADHLTSEPVVLAGLEVGWTSEMGSLAYHLLRVQEARYRQTGQVTIVSEDAIPRAPHYFYYYTVNYHGTQFAVTTQTGAVLTSPRWVSAKAAYAWHALQPTDYTRLAVDAVAAAASPARGWGSGVYERTGTSTGNENINTAAVILEAALYHARGRPLLAPD